MKRESFLFIIFISLIFLSTLQAKVWQREAPDSTGSDMGEYCSLAIDHENNPHIAYYDWEFHDLRYAYCRDGIWTIEIVDSVENAGEYCSIAVDSHNRPHISYRQDYLGYYWSLKYATKTDTGWVKMIIDTPKDTTYGEVGECSSIAIDKNDNPYISYVQEYPTAIKLAYKNASGWHFDLVTDVYSCNFTKIVFNNANLPVIGFHHWESDDPVIHNRLKIATLNPADSSWSVVTVPDSIGITFWGSLIGFDLDSQNKAYFAYIKYWDDFLRLAVYDGQNWSVETVTEDPWPSYSPSLTLKVDKYDKPTIVNFYGSEELHFYQKINGQWQYQMVDNVITFCEYCSLDFTSENYPCIAVYGRTRNYTRYALFYYRYWPGNPLIHLPINSYDFGNVWTQSFADWNCEVDNQGDAPLIINKLQLISPWWDTTFQIIKTPLPKTILPQRSNFITLRFKPRSEATFFDTLRISSNDSLQLETSVYLAGRGTSSGTTGNLLLTVNNIYIDHPYRLLRKDLPLKNVAVRLYQNGQQMYGPHYTGPNGQAQLSDIITGNYDIKLTTHMHIPGDQPNTSVLDSLSVIRPISIGPGGNSQTLFLPESLFVEKYTHIYHLTHIEKTSWNVQAVFGYHHSEELVKNLLDLWKVNLPDELETSIARLILNEYMVYHLFDPSYRMGLEFIHDVGDLINMLFYSDQYVPSLVETLLEMILRILLGDPLSAIINLVLEMVMNFLQSQLLDLIGEGIQQTAALLPNGGEQVVMAAWHDIRDQYSGWSSFLGGFSSDTWSHMKGLIYDHFKFAIFQFVYIDLMTDDKIEKGKNYSQQFQYNGEFTDSYNNATGFIADKLGNIETAESICRGLRTTAGLFNITSAMLDILGIFPIPGLGLLEALNTILKISAYVQVLSAVGISAYEFFSIPDYMDDAVDDIYFPEGKPLALKKEHSSFPRSRMSPEIRSLLVSKLWQSMNDYDSTIDSIKQYITHGEMSQALIAMDDLMESEKNFQNDLRSVLVPIYAVAKTAQDSLDNFTAMYDSIISYYAQAGESRFKNYLALMFLPTDTSQAMKDTVLGFLNRSIAANHLITEQATATLDSVSFLPIPAILMAKLVKQSQYELKSNEMVTIKIQVENVGSLPAHGVSICLKTNSALQIEEADSIYLGTLLPGQVTDTISWTVSLFDKSYTRGTWTAEVYSSDAKTYSASGSLVIPQPSSPPTGGKLSNANIYNYPNPFNPDKEQTVLRYSLEKTARVTIKIYDAGGNLVITLLDAVLQQAGEEQSVVWDGKNSQGDIVANGVYFNVIETSENERAVGKIAVLR